jgi:hypothetical protein
MLVAFLFFSGLQFPFSFFFFIAARLVDPPILLFRRIVIVVQITRIWKNKKGKIKIELCLVLFKVITIFFFWFLAKEPKATYVVGCEKRNWQATCGNSTRMTF